MHFFHKWLDFTDTVLTNLVTNRFFIYYMHKQFSKDKYLNLLFHPLIDDNRLLKKIFAVEFSSEHEKDN